MRTEKLRNRLKTDKRFRRSLCALFLAVGLAVTGISLAYLTSKDTVTNRVLSDYSNTLNIAVTEPKWDSEGELDAMRFVAGMEIDKDPYATNYMATDIYLRMKITVYDSKGNEVKLASGETLSLVTYNTSAAQPTNNYSAFLSTIYSGSSQLFSVDNGTITSNNSYFYYNDGWFYYLDYDGTNTATKLKSLTYKERTAVPLFTEVELPVFDTEYAVFESGFKIKITAEAVSVDEITDASVSNIVTIADVFNNGTNLNEKNAPASYGSDTATNNFTPAVVSVSVKENSETPKQTSEKELTWTPDDTTGTSTAQKIVQIHCNDDESNYTSCYVRVCLLPKWTSTVDNVAVEVLDNEMGNDITFPTTITGNTFDIDGVTFTLNSDWTTDWIYKDGYFYYKNVLKLGKDTSNLLESVSISSSDLTAHTDNGETLGVSVLTDAIQSDGGAVNEKWKVTLDGSGKITVIGG